MAEVSVDGNTGIYEMAAENLSFARKKLEVLISIMTWMKIKASGMTQQKHRWRHGPYFCVRRICPDVLKIITEIRLN
ncbi:MAG: hypothetical protein GX642_13145 [Smithella sp.]|nr:hypothetical protein [Smithella sp.]